MSIENALTTLIYFYRMVEQGGPDGSELDEAVCQSAKRAADWSEDYLGWSKEGNL